MNAGRNKDFAVTPPVNLAILASFVEQFGHEVSIIDELSGDNFRSCLNSFKPDIVGITGTTPLIPDSYRCADISRSLGYYTIMGGVHVSVMPDEALQHCDVVVIGEGELALKDIIDKLSNGIKIKGQIKGEIINDLDSIPRPAWHLIKMKYYTAMRRIIEISFLSFAPKEHNVGVLLTGRACPYDCTFCHNCFKGLPFRINSPRRVVDDIKFLMNAYDVGSIFFIEDNFFVHKERLKKICNLLIDEGIELIWGANSRVDNIDRETLQLAKKAGCRQVTFGWESGSQKILDILSKRTTVEQNYKSVELCNEVGILANGTVMIGNPEETEEDIRKTQRFMKEANIDGGIGVCITTPYPGTKIWDWCKEKGKIPDKFWWSDFNYHQVPIQVIDMELGKFMNLVNETVAIAIEKYRSTHL